MVQHCESELNNPIWRRWFEEYLLLGISISSKDTYPWFGDIEAHVLDDSTPDKIKIACRTERTQNTIHMIVFQKRLDGQFDNTNLQLLPVQQATLQRISKQLQR